MAPTRTSPLASAPLVAFVGVADLERAAAFYGQTLGLTLRDESPYALVVQVAGSTLRITATDQPAAAPYTVLGWHVDDIGPTIDYLEARGVRFARYDGMGQDDRGVWRAPSGSMIAWFQDPDGNVLSLTQGP